MCPHLLEIGEICFHPNHGVNVLRQSPEDTPSREEVFEHCFDFLCIIPGQTYHSHHHSALGSPSTSTLVKEAIRTAIAQKSPPPSSPTPSSNSHHVNSIRQDFPEPSALPVQQLCVH